MGLTSRKMMFAGAGFLILILLAIMGLKVYFNSERLRALVIPQMSDALGRGVVLKDVSLGFWGGVHVSVSGLVIADRQGFGSRPFVEVQDAQIYVAFWPLLRGEVVMGQVYLDKPQVSVVILQNGEANYADLLETPEGEGAEGSGVSVGEVVIRTGVVLYDDQKGQMQVQLKDIDYTLSLPETGMFQGDLSVGHVGWQQGDQQDALDTGVLRLRHHLKFERNIWYVTELDVTWAGLRLTMSGQVETQGDVSKLDLKIAEPGLDLGATRLRDIVRSEMDVTGIASVNVQIAGPLNLNVMPPVYPDVTGRVLLSKVTVVNAGQVAETHVDTAALFLEAGVLKLEVLKGSAFGGRFAATGQATSVWPPNQDKRVNVKVDAKTDVLQMPAQETQAETGDSDVSDILTGLRLLDADVSVQIGQVVGSAVEVQDLLAQAILKDGLLQVKTLRGNVYDGSVDLSGSFDARSGRTSFPIQWVVQMQNLNLKPLVPLDAGSELDGKLSASMRVRAVLDADLNPIFQAGQYTLLGTASVTKGRYNGPDLLTPVDSLALGIEFVQDNVLLIKQLEARAGQSDVSLTGRIVHALDYALKPATIRPEMVAQVRADVLNLDALFPTEMPAEGDQTSGLLLGIRQGDGRVQVSVGKLVSDSTVYTDFQAVAIANGGILKVDSIRAHTLGGVLTAQAELDGRTNLVPLQAVASLSRVQANKLLQDYMRWPIPMLGQLGVSVTMDGKMDSTLTLVEKTIRADGEARMDDGRVVNWPWLQTASGFVPHLQFMNFSDLPLKALSTSFKMDQGRVFLNQMGFQSGDVGFQLAGSVGVDGTLDMAVDANVPTSRLNVSGLGLDRVPGLNLKPDARIPLRIHVGGSSDKPKIEAKLQPEAQKALETKSQEVKEKAKDKAKSLIKSLF